MTSPGVAAQAGNTPRGRPTRVNWALTALSAAWAVSLVALLLNQFLYSGSGIGPGWVPGILSLILQALTYSSVGRGRPIARGLTVAFLLLAALRLPMVGRLIVERSAWSATYLARPRVFVESRGRILAVYGRCGKMVCERCIRLRS